VYRQPEGGGEGRRRLPGPAERARDEAVEAGPRTVLGREVRGRARCLLHAQRGQPRIVRGTGLLRVLDEDELDDHRASARRARARPKQVAGPALLRLKGTPLTSRSDTSRDDDKGAAAANPGAPPVTLRPLTSAAYTVLESQAGG
jgi:hypothetical protein